MKPSVPHIPISVAVVEDDARIRNSLARVIARSPKLRLLESFPEATSALERLPALAPNVVVMDLELPAMNGIDCTRKLRRLLPATQVLVFTVFGDSDQVFRALAAGASGYILKRTPRDEIIEAIVQVWQGGAPMSAEIARAVVESFRELSAPTPRAAAHPQLTAREEDVLRLLARGLIVKEIADSINVGVDTVKYHLKNIYEKLHARSRTEALIKSGFLQPPDDATSDRGRGADERTPRG